MRIRLKVLAIISAFLLIVTSCGGGSDRTMSSESAEDNSVSESQTTTDDATSENTDETADEATDKPEESTEA